MYHRQSAGSMNGASSILAVAANQDQSGGQFLLLRTVIMRGGMAYGHRVSPHGRTVYNSGTGEVLSAVLSPDFVHRVHGSRSDANAPDNV